MKPIIISVETENGISIITMKLKNLFFIQTYQWPGEARFPLKAMLKGIFILSVLSIKTTFQLLLNKLITN